MPVLPLNRLGAIETNGTVTFGILLPWVDANAGNQLRVKIINEDDQFLQTVPPQEFPLVHSRIEHKWVGHRGLGVGRRLADA